ncbi:MAG TPA: ATP-binding protein [Gemmataceae bacterium]|nr:ATP-binding protein [Gemmataceae bacterium]
MRSIRLSLLLYFLMLLAVALGAASVCAYQYTQRVLDAKLEAREQLLKKQYEEDCRRKKSRFDDALLQKAFLLAQQAQIQHGMMARAVTEIQFQEGLLSSLDPRSLDNSVNEFFQIDIHSDRNNTTRRSSSMGDHLFAFDLETYKNTPLYQAQFDDTQLEAGLTVRRVTLKAPVARWVTQPPRRIERSGDKGSDGQLGDGRRRPPPPPQEPRAQEPRERATPALYIQFAAERTQLDEQLLELRKNLESDLATLSEDSATTLSTLRNRLVLIGLVTFAATLVGGVWLVRLGLSPLQRLSEAVSRVSAKDFRLPFEEKRLPQELRPIVERLTQTLDLLKRTFAREKQAAADISHELRTPLAALLTTIEVALRKPRSTEEYRELLTDCHATGLQMNQLIERLLALARLDAGVDNLRPRDVDASSLAEQCATLVRPLVDARGLSLHVERNGPIVLHTDADKLREILTNLLHNAIEYNRPEGSIELALERQNGHVLLEVKDTGIGIAPEAQEHIFERFYRADPSRQADGLHAGIGLAIVKGYVDLMGGTISVESAEGQGTTFRVELPAR